MKKTKIFYWIVTGIFAAGILLSGINDAASSPGVLEVFRAYQLPAYLSPFMGIAKILGAIAILIPGLPRIKEWAYAGLFFDLLGASYCGWASGHHDASILFMLIFFAFLFASYALYHRKTALTV